MQQKILIIGASGLIGHQVYRQLEQSAGYKLFNMTLKSRINEQTKCIDARNEVAFFNYIKTASPDFIVNCVGALIESSNQNIENALFLNAYLPHKLSRIASSINAKLIHISTDCVFSGLKKGGYHEYEEKDGSDNYAKTKSLGEIISDEHLTLRTSVVGPELSAREEELFQWFMAQSGSIFGYTKSIWSGITTLELARVVEASIVQNISGIYNVCSSTKISKYELLKLFKHYSNKHIEIIPVDEPVIDKSLIDNRKLLSAFPSYDKMIFEMVNHIKENQKTYPHIKLL